MKHIICFAYLGQPGSASFAVAGEYALRENECFCSFEQSERYGSFILQDGLLVDIGNPPSHLHYFDGGWKISPDNFAFLLNESKASAIKAVAIKHGAMLSQLTGNATAEDRDTWPVKLPAALESIAMGEPTADAIGIFALEAAADNVSVMDKCRRSAAKAAAFKHLTGVAAGIKADAENAINQARSYEEVKQALSVAASAANTAAQKFLEDIKGKI